MLRSSRKLGDTVQRIERCIEAAKRLRKLNMFITETFEDALQDAKMMAAGKSESTGPLAGSILAVKDCFSTKDVLTTCGSRMLSNYVPPYSATVVQKLKDSGAVMLGKTNLDEFCMGASSTESFYGPVKNPWTLKLWKDHAQVDERLAKDWFLAGGSSGGSAAAVAAGVVDIALGSDTGGSTRNPASFCGVIGLKPTYGLLSRHGLIPLTNSLDVPGIFARSVDEVALALEIAAGRDPKDSTTIDRPSESFVLPPGNVDLNGLTVGLPKEYFVDGLSDQVLDWWRRIAALLETQGKCNLKIVSLPHTKYSIICYHVLGEAEVASNMARYDGLRYGFRADETSSLNKMYAEGRHEAFNEVVRRRILAGNFFLLRNYYERFYMKSLKVRRLISEDFKNVFRKHGVDVLLTPVTLSDAPLYSEWKSDDGGYQRERSDDFFTQPVNMAGIPAVSIPVGLSNRGLPVGLQLIGDVLSDKKILNVAKWIEKRVDYPRLNFNDLL